MKNHFEFLVGHPSEHLAERHETNAASRVEMDRYRHDLLVYFWGTALAVPFASKYLAGLLNPRGNSKMFASLLEQTKH